MLRLVGGTYHINMRPIKLETPTNPKAVEARPPITPLKLRAKKASLFALPYLVAMRRSAIRVSGP